ncbi:MAG TPA: biopolymer transporter ExbD [Burkholderiaceae bacterium]
MAFGGFNDHKHSGPMAEINVTPMVDVMLVLLVIFIITAPLFTHALKLDLPNAPAAPAGQQPAVVALAIDAEGKIYWDELEITRDEMRARMALQAKQKTQPEIQLRADKKTAFEVVADVMSAAQSSGLTKIGFVTEPKPKQP